MKKTWLLSLLLILALALSACAGGGTDIEGTDTTDGLGTEVVPGDGLGTEVVEPGVPLATEPVEEVTEEPLATDVVEPTVAPTDVVGGVEATPMGTVEGTGVPETGGIVNDDFLLCVVIDYDVQDVNGEDLGDVNDFVLDASGNRIQYVVLGAGGFLGIGEQDLLVPFDQFTVGSEDADEADDDRVLVYTGDADRLENAPVFDLDAVDFDVDGWDADYVTYWSGDFVPETSGTPAAVEATAVPMATTVVESTAVPADDDVTVTEDVNFVLASELCGAWVVDETTFGTEGAVDTTGTGTAESTVVPPSGVNATPGVEVTPGAVDVSGTPVAGDDMGTVFDQIGEVGNVVLDPETGDVTYLVIDPDDDVIDDDVWMPVPLNGVRIVHNLDTAELNDVLVLVEADMLSEAPSVEADNLPDLSVAGWDDDFVGYWGITR